MAPAWLAQLGSVWAKKRKNKRSGTGIVVLNSEYCEELTDGEVKGTAA
jgi:hypothetical protein